MGFFINNNTPTTNSNNSNGGIINSSIEKIIKRIQRLVSQGGLERKEGIEIIISKTGDITFRKGGKLGKQFKRKY